MAKAKRQETDHLAEYRAKRDFAKTPEPDAKTEAAGSHLYVIQKHAATRTHFDLRLELDGVLKSWAVTKGPSTDPHQRRLAVRTEDHPLAYGGFEGVIPKGEYGAGPVMLWDQGRWEPIGDPHQSLAKGHLDFLLKGKRLKGEWHLVRMKKDRTGGKRENWLLIKGSDAYAEPGGEPTEEFDTSVETGRSMEEIRDGESAVWSSDPSKRPSAKKKPEGKAGAAPSPGKDTGDGFVQPELATPSEHVPDTASWLHEIKYDGYRIIARKEGASVTLFSRGGLDWTVRFPAIAKAVAALPCKSATLDGEVAFVLPSGLTDFKSLQQAIDTNHPAIRYFIFDLLALNGNDLRDKPLTARKAKLKALLGKTPASNRLIYADEIEGQGKAFFANACKAGLEGIMSKRANARYRSGRSKAWLKIKCTRGAEFVIGGFTKSTVRGRPFASLLLGTFENGTLIYAGKVGTGFNAASMTTLAAAFKPLTRKTSPFEAVPMADRRNAVWLTPKLVCAVAFTEWTADGRLRHPSFQGLREDKPARTVHRDRPEAGNDNASLPAERTKAKRLKTAAAAATTTRRTEKATKPKPEPATFSGITLTHPDRVLFPELGLTKLQLADYYADVASWMLPYLTNRPISLVRCPEGTAEDCFFQRHAMKGMSDAIKEVAIPGGSTRRKYLYIEDAKGLFALVQIGVLEIHDWGVSLKAPEKPDRVVFDLDPAPGLPLDTLKAAVVEIRDFLADLGLKSFLKSTGGKGFHIVAPMTPKAGWDEVKVFCKGVAEALVAVRGDRYTATMSKTARGGKIFIDYFRNQRGGSAIVNFSTRARTDAPVATPLRWDELAGLSHPAAYTVANLPARLRALKSDPWEGFFKTRQSITAKAKKALGIG